MFTQLLSIPKDDITNLTKLAKIANFANIVNCGALSPNLPFLSSRAFLDISEYFITPAMFLRAREEERHILYINILIWLGIGRWSSKTTPTFRASSLMVDTTRWLMFIWSSEGEFIKSNLEWKKDYHSLFGFYVYNSTWYGVVNRQHISCNHVRGTWLRSPRVRCKGWTVGDLVQSPVGFRATNHYLLKAIVDVRLEPLKNCFRKAKLSL